MFNIFRLKTRIRHTWVSFWLASHLMAPQVQMETGCVHWLEMLAQCPMLSACSLILGSPLEMWGCSEALAQMDNILVIYLGQYGFLAFLGTLLGSSLPQCSLPLSLSFIVPHSQTPNGLGYHHSIILTQHLTGPGAPRPVKNSGPAAFAWCRAIW